MTLRVERKTSPERCTWSARVNGYAVFDGLYHDKKVSVRWYPDPILDLSKVLGHVEEFYYACIYDGIHQETDDARMTYTRVNHNRDTIEKQMVGNPVRRMPRDVSRVSFCTTNVSVALQNRTNEVWSPEPPASSVLALRSRNSYLAQAATRYEASAYRDMVEKLWVEKNPNELRKLWEKNIPLRNIPTSLPSVGGTISCEATADVRVALTELLRETARADMRESELSPVMKELFSPFSH